MPQQPPVQPMQPPVQKQPQLDEMMYEEEEVKNDNAIFLVTAEICNLCQRTFSPDEESKGEKLMIQETFCFHTIHKACLIELVWKAPAGPVNCPEKDCGKTIPDMEIAMYLNADQKAKLEELQLQ